MYAQMADKMDIEKETFYDDLQKIVDRTPKSYTILVLCDANAKLGKEDVYNEVSGKHMLHELSNRNGKMVHHTLNNTFQLLIFYTDCCFTI
jgi:hypothetical protein